MVNRKAFDACSKKSPRSTRPASGASMGTFTVQARGPGSMCFRGMRSYLPC